MKTKIAIYTFGDGHAEIQMSIADGAMYFECGAENESDAHEIVESIQTAECQVNPPDSFWGNDDE